MTRRAHSHPDVEAALVATSLRAGELAKLCGYADTRFAPAVIAAWPPNAELCAKLRAIADVGETSTTRAIVAERKPMGRPPRLGPRPPPDKIVRVRPEHEREVRDYRDALHASAAKARRPTIRA